MFAIDVSSLKISLPECTVTVTIFGQMIKSVYILGKRFDLILIGFNLIFYNKDRERER